MNSSTKLKEKISNNKFFQKLKSIKHFELIIVVIFICILLLIYFSDFSSTKSKSSTNITTTFTSYSNYTKDLETRLSKVLSNIKGVGKVNVMITLTSSPELVIAYNTEEKTVSNSLTGTNEQIIIYKEPIIITENGNSKPLILTEILPSVKGVLIVAEGAEDVAIKLDILTATTKLLNVSTNSIEIFASK